MEPTQREVKPAALYSSELLLQASSSFGSGIVIASGAISLAYHFTKRAKKARCTWREMPVASSTSSKVQFRAKILREPNTRSSKGAAIPKEL